MISTCPISSLCCFFALSSRALNFCCIFCISFSKFCCVSAFIWLAWIGKRNKSNMRNEVKTAAYCTGARLHTTWDMVRNARLLLISSSSSSLTDPFFQLHYKLLRHFSAAELGWRISFIFILKNKLYNVSTTEHERESCWLSSKC